MMDKPTPKQFLFINRKAPYGSFYAHEALDALLMTAAFGQHISVLFLEDGVFQLKKNQQPQDLGMKNFNANLSALPVYDVTALYVSHDALTERGLTQADLILPVTLLDNIAIHDLMAKQDVTLSF
jgi:tRNA 2-thiouridine synthesizing protein C